ncbi:MAG: CapA family protein [Myxococcaceae bacterium]|nr:CapA family protein [Myxococcaceae bacterium]MCI0669655.1 CapA family protein [Myxococcaceae bacterium]
MRRLLLPLLVLAACAPRVPETRPPAVAAPPPPQAPSVAPPPEARPFTLLAGGDVTLGYHYEEYFDDQVARGATREEMAAYGFKELRPVADGADLFLVNLECPFTDRGEKVPKNFNFRARPELVSALLAGGVDAVSLANNHLLDYGVVGLMDTLATLDAARIPHFGAGRNLAEARRPAIVTVNGTRVALLGYYFLGTRNIEPPEVIATDTTPGVAGHAWDVEAMERMVREDVTAARAVADVVIPFFHWGIEGNGEPEPYQVRLGRAAVEAGASAVLGSHPHVLQGMELHQGAPIVYSLGNLVFGGNWDPRDKRSALFKARFGPGGYLGSELVALQTDRYPERPMQPFPLEGEAREAVLRTLVERSAVFPTPLPELQAALAAP